MKKSRKAILAIASVIVIAVVVLLVIHWDDTKKAADDAWNGKYEPPAAQTE